MLSTSGQISAKKRSIAPSTLCPEAVMLAISALILGGRRARSTEDPAALRAAQAPMLAPMRASWAVIPGLDATQKELLNMVAAAQPEITAQLARIGANIGAWAALNAAGSSVDLAR